MTSRDPQAYPRRVLLATAGMTPAVVTETLWALRRQPQPFVPTEIHCVTTSIGARGLTRHFIDGPVLRDYIAEFGPPDLAGALTADRIHVAAGPDGPLADFLTEDDNAAFADLIVDLVRTFTADPDTALHVSIAGGRKTMTFLGGYVLSIFARPQDRLSHVLVDPRFEKPGFFYPPDTPREIELPDPPRYATSAGNAEPIRLPGEIVNTADANIRLAEIPILRLSGFLKHNPIGGPRTYSEVVELAQKLVDPPELVVDIPNQRLVCQGVPVPLGPAVFALAVYFARRIIDEEDMHAGAIGYEEFIAPREQDDFRRIEDAAGPDAFGDMDAEERRRKRGGKPISRGSFDSYKSRINDEIETHLAGLAPRYQIQTLRRKPAAAGFRLEPGQIRIVPAGPHQETAE